MTINITIDKALQILDDYFIGHPQEEVDAAIALIKAEVNKNDSTSNMDTN